MANKVKIKRSITSLAPLPGTLEHGELAMGQVSGETRLSVGNSDKSNKTLIHNAEQLTNLLTNTATTGGVRKGISVVNGQYSPVIFVNNEGVDPTENADSSLGFIPGSLWYNPENNKLWSAQDTGAGAAVWNLVNSPVSSPLTFKGSIDASSNPNYPASTVGDVYVVNIAGKIGGANGVKVEPGDQIFCVATTPAGDHATVGVNFSITQANIDGAVTSSSTISNNNAIVVFDGASGKIIKDSTILIDKGNISNTVSQRDNYGNISASGFKKKILELSANGDTTTLSQTDATFIQYFDDIANSTLILPDAVDEVSWGREYTIVNYSGNKDISLKYIQETNTFDISVLKPYQQMTVRNRVGEYSFGSVINLDQRHSPASQANTIAVRDNNRRLKANGVINDITTYTEAGALFKTLSNADDRIQRFSNSLGVDTGNGFVLPDATTLPIGDLWTFINKADKVLEIYALDQTTVLYTRQPNEQIQLSLMDNTTANGIWKEVFSSDTAIDGGTF